MNSRPLTYLSEDTDDLVPISPSMFLIEKPESGVTDIDAVDSTHFRKRIRYRMRLVEELRKRFRKEYLSQLLQKSSKKKRSPELKLGEIVLVGDDHSKRLNWPLAKVVELIPGKDGHVRTVKVKTQNGVLLRPIQRIFPLEMSNDNLPSDFSFQVKTGIRPLLSEPPVISPKKEPSSNSPKVVPILPSLLPKVSRSGRVVKPRQRLDLCNAVEVLSLPKVDSKGGSMLALPPFGN